MAAARTRALARSPRQPASLTPSLLRLVLSCTRRCSGVFVRCCSSEWRAPCGLRASVAGAGADVSNAAGVLERGVNSGLLVLELGGLAGWVIGGCRSLASATCSVRRGGHRRPCALASGDQKRSTTVRLRGRRRMRRVAVIGSGGSGKSTFARQLGARTGLPVIHLDRLFWKPGWVPTPARGVARAAGRARARWRVNPRRQLQPDTRRPSSAADTVFFFDMPTWLSVGGVLRRWAHHHGQALQADGCPERVSLPFLLWVWRYRRNSRPRVLEQLRSHAGDARVVVVRSRRDAAAALRAPPISAAVRQPPADRMN